MNKFDFGHLRNLFYTALVLALAGGLFATVPSKSARAASCVSASPTCGNPNGACHMECVRDYPTAPIGTCRTVFDDPLSCDNEDNNFVGCEEEGDICEVDPLPPDVCETSPPSIGTNVVYGKVKKVWDEVNINNSGKQIKTQNTAWLPGVTVAWIEDPNLANEKGSRKSIRRFTYTKADSVTGDMDGDGAEEAFYRLEGLPNKPMFMGVFCGEQILQVWGVKWQDCGGVGFSEVEIPITVFEDITCENNNVCIRPDADRTDYTDYKCGITPVNTPDKTPITYDWRTPPAFRNNLNWLKCALDVTGCLADAIRNLGQVIIRGGVYITPDELTSSRGAWIESRMMGVDPSVGLTDGIPECSAVSSVNLISSGWQPGEGGRATLKGMNPSKQEKLVRDLIAQNPKYCKDSRCPTDPETNEKICRAADAEPPIKLAGGGTYILEREYIGNNLIDYFPYYLLPLKPNFLSLDRTELDVLVAGTGGGSQIQTKEVCTGYNCSEGNNTGPGFVPVDLRGGAYSSIAGRFGSGFAGGLVSRAGKNTEVPSEACSGVYRVELFGKECDCPGGEIGTDGRCKSGSIKLDFFQAMEARCLVPNPPPECSSAESADTLVQTEIPNAKQTGAACQKMVNAFIRPGGNPVRNIGGLGTTTMVGGPKNADVPTPYGVEGLGTCTTAKERLGGSILARPKSQD